MNDDKDIIKDTAEEESTEETAESAAEEVIEEADQVPSEKKTGDSESEKPLKKRIIEDAIDIIESTLVTVFVIGMIFTYLLHPVSVQGDSMNPTLYNDDRIMMTTVYFGLKYGDIVVVDNDTAYDIDENGEPVAVNIDGDRLQECIIKRVIATPGQTIDIKDGKAYVDDKELDEPYIAKGAQTNTLSGFSGKYPFKVPEGYYFVMGDNRERSSDSRDSRVGLIKKSQIYGKAVLRYQPLDKFKFLWNSVNESAE